MSDLPDLNKGLVQNSELSSCSSSLKVEFSEDTSTVHSKCDEVEKLLNFKKSLQKEGHVDEDNGHFSYVANDFLEKLKVQDNLQSKRRTDIPNINPELLGRLEADCLQLTSSVNCVVEELTKRLHGISAISVANTQACSAKIDQMQQCVNAGTHSLYSLIAHCEELDQSMKPIYQLAQKISNLKDIVVTLENYAQL